MTCQISSGVDIGGVNIAVSTEVDPEESTEVNIEDHIRDVGTTAGVGAGTSIATSWPGNPTPVVTTRRPDETLADWLKRHQVRCKGAAASHPINC